MKNPTFKTAWGAATASIVAGILAAMLASFASILIGHQAMELASHMHDDPFVYLNVLLFLLFFSQTLVGLCTFIASAALIVAIGQTVATAALATAVLGVLVAFLSSAYLALLVLPLVFATTQFGFESPEGPFGAILVVALATVAFVLAALHALYRILKLVLVGG